MLRLLAAVTGVLLIAELASAQGQGQGRPGIRERRRDGSCLMEGVVPPCVAATSDAGPNDLRDEIARRQQRLEELVRAPEVNAEEVAGLAKELRSLQDKRNAMRPGAEGRSSRWGGWCCGAGYCPNCWRTRASACPRAWGMGRGAGWGGADGYRGGWARGRACRGGDGDARGPAWRGPW